LIVDDVRFEFVNGAFVLLSMKDAKTHICDEFGGEVFVVLVERCYGDRARYAICFFIKVKEILPMEIIEIQKSESFVLFVFYVCDARV